MSLGSLILFSRAKMLDVQLVSIEKQIQVAQKQSGLSDSLQVRVVTLKNKIDDEKKLFSDLQQKLKKMESGNNVKNKFSSILAHITSSLPPSVTLNHCLLKDNYGEISGSTLRYKDLPQLVSKVKNDPRFISAQIRDIDKVATDTIEPFTFTIIFTLP
jgi:hypothetical protein